MKIRFWVLILVTAVILAALITMGLVKQPGRGNAKPTNIVFISIDTLRADHLSCYGYDRLTSPSIDKLAGEGVRFAKAYSQTSWTLPSHMSMMTSQYPHIHKVQTGQFPLSESKVTLAEMLSDAGYYTQAFVSWIYVTKKYGFAQGFDKFEELVPPSYLVDPTTHWSYKAEKVTDTVLNWIKTKPTETFFLFVHYFDPHIDYEPPPPYDRMFDPDYKGTAEGTFTWIRTYIKGAHKKPQKIKQRDLQYITALYDGEIRYTDTHVGRLLDGIDENVGLDNCLVILTSDHGEELNEHGSMEGHQWTLYDEIVHVPLIFRFPKKAYKSTVIESQVQLIDIAPTIAELVGIGKPAGFQGQSMMKLIEGKEGHQSEQISFAETKRHTIKQSVRTGRHKLIHTNARAKGRNGLPVVEAYELYDLREDPTEQNNIYNASSTLAKTLSEKLQTWRISTIETAGGEETRPKVKLTPEEIERLRSLGYTD